MTQPRLQIAGTVHAERAFHKEIGSGLALVLTPNGDSGWTIEVQPLDGSDNFVRCVTLPLHGPTQADVLATQFVTEDNVKLPDAELSDVKKREFQFVVNAADQKKACAEMEDEAYGKPKTAPMEPSSSAVPGTRSLPWAVGAFSSRRFSCRISGPASTPDWTL